LGEATRRNPPRRPFFVHVAVACGRADKRHINKLDVAGGSAAPPGDVINVRLRRLIFNIEQGTARSTFRFKVAPMN
jgi:hypothetical protein